MFIITSMNTEVTLCINSYQTYSISMDWIKEDDRVLYKPMKAFYVEGRYGQALQLCWGSELYSEPLKSLIHFLDLKKKGQVPQEITEIMFCDWLVSQGKKSFTARLWRSALEDGCELAWLTYEINSKLKMANMICEAKKKLEARRAASASNQLCARVQNGVMSIMADVSREQSSPTLLGPKRVLVELVPRVLMALWPQTKIHTYLALSDMAVGMAAAILNRISSSAKKTGDVLLQVDYSKDRCSEMVDAILGKTSEMFLPGMLAEALDARCLKLITLLTDITGGHILVMFGMAPDTSVEAGQSSEENSAAKATEARMDSDSVGEPGSMGVPITEASTPAEKAVISEACNAIIEAPVVEAPIIVAPVVEAPIVEAPIIKAPDVEAPIIEAPIVEAPIIEAPVVEASIVEAPVVEAPIIVAPVVQAPIIVAPVVEAPFVEVSIIEAPVDEAHIIETPIFENPAVKTTIIEASVHEGPIIEAPVVEAPIIKAPDVEAPIIEAPIVEATIIEAPVVEASIIEAPVVEAPIVVAPFVEAPIVEAPMIEAPVKAPITEAPIVQAHIIKAPVVKALITEAAVIEAPITKVSPSLEKAFIAELYTTTNEAPSVEACFYIDEALTFVPSKVPQPEVPISRAKRVRRAFRRIFHALCCGCCCASSD